MMYGIAFIVTLLCVGAAQASICCFPRQYEASQGLMRATVKNGQLSILYGNIHYWYDAVSRRETFLESLTVDGFESRVTVIKDYNVTNTKYVISGDKCTQKPLTPFKEGCIPDWATQLVHSHYATNSSGMNMNVYNNSAGAVTSFLVASDDCYPILDISAQPTGAAANMQAVMFYNFTLGIRDYSIFEIPSVCKHSSPVGK